MSIKVLANASLQFQRGEEKVKVKVGFGELPNWVGDDPFYKEAVATNLIKEFSGNNPTTTEDLTKHEERKAVLEQEIAGLQDQLDDLKGKMVDFEDKATTKRDEIKKEIEELTKQRDALRSKNK